MPFVPDTQQPPIRGIDPGTGPSGPRFVPDAPQRNSPWDYLHDVGVGFNRMLVKTLGVGPEVVNEAMRGLGVSDVPSGTYTNEIADAFRKVGVHVDSRTNNELVQNLGPDIAMGLTGAGALAALAREGGAAAASAATRLGPRLLGALKEMGKQVIARPGATVASEAGASMGASEGRKITKGTPYEPLGAMVGGLTGGFSAGALTSSARSVIRSALPKSDPLIAAARDPSLVTLYAQETVDSAKKAIDDEIASAVNSVVLRTPKGHFVGPQSELDMLKAPILSARRVQQTVVKSDKAAQARETAMWEGAGLDRPIDVTELKNLAAQLGAENENFPQFLPGNILKAIDNLPDTATIGDLIGSKSIRSVALAMLRNPGSAGVLDYNLNQIQSKVMDMLGAAYPKDQAIQAARAFSVWRNDHFYRPGSAWRPLLRNPAEQDARAAVQGLIGREIGGEAVADVASTLNQPALVADVARQLRDEFRASAATMSPEDAAKWLTRPEVRLFMKEMPEQMADLTMASDRLQNAFQARDLLNESVFTKLAGRDIRSAVEGLFNAGDKGKAAREIVMSLPHDADPAALEGLQNSVITSFIGKAGGSPSRLKEMLNDRSYRDMLQAVLTGPKYARFVRLVDDGAAVEAGDTGLARKLFRRPVVLLSRIWGAAAGRALNTGTIQGPGITSGLFGRMADRLVGTTDPAMSLALAVTNPKYERLLRSTVPRNRREAVALVRATQLALSSQVVQAQEARTRMSKLNIPKEVRP